MHKIESMIKKILFFYLFFSSSLVFSNLIQNLSVLKNVYSDHIKEISEEYIIWKDGTKMLLNKDLNKSYSERLNNTSLFDQIAQEHYKPGIPVNFPNSDSGRIRYEFFFRKMYGDSAEEVKKNLITIDWMPRIFGEGTYKLLVTKINNISQKIICISKELEELTLTHSEFIKFLKNPGGTFCWRNIANTNRLSNHSFGMTIDINAQESNYWQWDLVKLGSKITEEALVEYNNKIPIEIVLIFEKYGFIWGGKWYHYDTMHFEYRPELFSV